MGGSPFISTERLKSGVPLHFTVRVSTTQGAHIETMCSIPTYDITPPMGRVSWYQYTSHPHFMRGNMVVLDDSELKEDNFVALGYGGKDSGDQVMVLYCIVYEYIYATLYWRYFKNASIMLQAHIAINARSIKEN